MSRIPDNEIRRLYRSDPAEAFRIVVEQYREPLYYHIRRIVILHHDADDALQNTFLRCWESMGQFRWRSSLYTWLYRIASNEALKILKRREREPVPDPLSLDKLFDSSEEGGRWFNGDEAEKRLLEAILTLPPKQQLVFNLRYFDELSFSEIGKILNRSTGALKASYHLARKKIEEILKQD